MPKEGGQSRLKPATDRSDAQPNIVVIFSDDAGYADFGFQPDADTDLAPLTPHIDSIARDGVRFTNFYMSACVCSPSRAGLLTGRYQQRFGHECNIPPGYMKGGMALSEQTIADRLRADGYATGIIGKWHLGYPDEYHPNERGFDEFYGCLQGSRSYYALKRETPHRIILDNREATPEADYLTDRFGRAAADFIGQHANEPFFLFVSFTAPHGPLEARPGDLELPELARIEDQKRRKYAGLVKAMDDNVGVILEALERAGIADDTLVLFTNDNGGQTETGANNYPLRGRKGMLYEGGIRVPAAARWPAVIEAGGVIDEPLISLDLTPTFLNLARASVQSRRATALGAADSLSVSHASTRVEAAADAGRATATQATWQDSPPDPQASEAALDGIDISPLLFGEPIDMPSRSLMWRSKGSESPIAIRRGRWKLVRLKREVPAELYDLDTDIAEVNNLARQHPELVEELLQELGAWESQLIEPLWSR
ncbi:MAG: arylsulfatase A-like enzyme [Planctomycetota bacterium]|jgi:arylsulfatase A-like enzyme